MRLAKGRIPTMEGTLQVQRNGRGQRLRFAPTPTGIISHRLSRGSRRACTSRCFVFPSDPGLVFELPKDALASGGQPRLQRSVALPLDTLVLSAVAFMSRSDGAESALYRFPNSLGDL
jgi:hypothetical protein